MQDFACGILNEAANQGGQAGTSCWFLVRWGECRVFNPVEAVLRRAARIMMLSGKEDFPHFHKGTEDFAVGKRISRGKRWEVCVPHPGCSRRCRQSQSCPGSRPCPPCPRSNGMLTANNRQFSERDQIALVRFLMEPAGVRRLVLKIKAVEKDNVLPF